MKNCTNHSTCSFNASDTNRGHSNLSSVLSTTLTALMCLVVFSLGCTVEARKLWSHLKRPWGILVGLLCQFGLMPLLAFALAKAFSVKPVQAVAILIMGCCPGGTISNILTYWIDGDMDLSICMTATSTVLAMGMMPLCLYIYTSSWVHAENIRIPYYNIGTTLITLIVPISGGVFVNYKWPKQAKIILKVGSTVGGLLILAIAIASSVLYKGSWNTDISILIIGIIYPLLGYTAGFVLAVILQQPWFRCRTVALETGAQNVQLCTTILQVSFSPEQLVLMFTFPMIYGSFQLIYGLLMVAVVKISKRICQKKLQDHSEDSPVCEDVADTMPSGNILNGAINPGFAYSPSQEISSCVTVKYTNTTDITQKDKETEDAHL
ncbi:solute carrier family 10 member 6 [Protopterus annectens]|uniref:solute carrier family 10 member 6 n=1 Tax=Protopterus annectens TaxID=7888 RepID=UPI001CF95C55|nr:solute carrier family 10 member 6 [Protopterus annectens]